MAVKRQVIAFILILLLFFFVTNAIGQPVIPFDRIINIVFDSINSALRVNCVVGCGGGGGGIQYTEGDIDTTITGTAVIWEDTSDILRAVSVAKPLPVNVVAGGAGGGVAQLQVRNSGDTAWVNIGVGAESASVLKLPVRLHDASGNIAAILNVAPSTEYGLVTRNIPSGTQVISGTITANAGSGTFTIAGTVISNQGTPAIHANRWPIGISDGTAFISPATDRITSAAPFAFRLSDGTSFYDATKTGQLPAALVGGRLDVNIGASAVIAVSQSGAWTVTSNQGTPNTTANRWPVQLTDGTSLNSFTGTSANVNCTGGCGAPSIEPTFWAYTAVSACAANKFQLVLYNNNATTLVKIRLVAVQSVQITAITGALPTEWVLRKRDTPTTDPSGAGTVTIHSVDSVDTLATSITAFNAPGTAPAGGTTRDFYSFVPQPDEIKLETTAMSAPTFQSIQNGDSVPGIIIYNALMAPKPITLRQDQTLELQQSATAGTCNFRIFVLFSTV